MLGSSSLRMIRQPEAPLSRAASMNSRSRSEDLGPDEPADRHPAEDQLHQDQRHHPHVGGLLLGGRDEQGHDHRGEGDEEQLLREGQHQVREPAEEVVGPAAQIPLHQADEDADDHRDRGDREGDEQRGADAVDQKREHVAAELRFDAEPEVAVDPAVGLERNAVAVQQPAVLPVQLVGVLSVQLGDEWSGHCDQDESEDRKGTQDSDLVAFEPDPRETPG